jgi:hypothetical protein
MQQVPLSAAFYVGAEPDSRNPGPPRSKVQTQARLITEMAPNPYDKIRDGGLTYPYPGKGVSGETTN